MAVRSHLAHITQRNRSVCLKSFYRFLVKNAGAISDPTAELELPRIRDQLPPNVLTKKEMARLLAQPGSSTVFGMRDRAVLELLYSTGIRKRELVNLSVSDFHMESRELLIANGKGGKDRVVPVGEWACYFTEASVKNVRPWLVSSPAEKALFVRHRNGQRHSPRAVGDIVEKAAARSGVGRRVSPHTFRHSMTTHMLQNQADLRHIQAILGHTSLRSTQVSTHVDIEDLKEVVRRSHPHGRRTAAVKLSQPAELE